MSIFYLSAVKGDVPVHLMETIIIRRLEYFRALLKENRIVYNEYVIEGSVYDNIGHFMLCIIAILGENTEFSQFVFKAEMELFKHRLEALTAYDMRSFAKKLIRTIKKLECTPPYVEALTILTRHLLLKDLANHICVTHSSKCECYKIKVYFKHCMPFIAKREVELRQGLALIPCGKWKQYLTMLYHRHLNYRLKKINLDSLKSDPRIAELLYKVKCDFFPHTTKNSFGLLSKEVDKASSLFPPCMLNLHNRLRKNHRLSHSQRFYYSLFLKDIGMPVEEAIFFWKAEYKRIPYGNHSCSHNWEKDEKKYLYGIRHLYGLEGGRKNYTSVNCQRIQSIDNACTEGGCPFKSFDRSKMLPLLSNPSDQLMSQINENRYKNKYTESCKLYLKSLVEIKDCDKLSLNFTPVKYYSITSNNTKL